MNQAFVYIIGLGFTVFFGFQGSLALAVRHYHQKNQSQRSKCDQVLHSPYAFMGKVPIAYVATLFYAVLLGQLIGIFTQGQDNMRLVTYAAVFAIIATCYYAYLLFFKLNSWCWGCIRIYITNLLMGICLIGYHFNHYAE
ncbi:vitamin K epoxide reductase family protein [Deltaproteobacteria bacterium TL4]